MPENPGEQLRHLIVEGRVGSQRFTNPQRIPGGDFRTPARNRLTDPGNAHPQPSPNAGQRHSQALANDRVVGLQVSQRWTGPDSFQLDGKRHRIVQADSELAVREAFAEAAGGTHVLVILSSLQANALGEDVRARMVQPKNPLVPISSREILRELFKAKEVDARLQGLRWMAEALVEAQPVEGFPPVPGGRLDEETAWETFLRQVLGFRSGRPDLLDVITWAREPKIAACLHALDGDAAAAVEQWVARSAGAASALVFAAVRHAQAVPVPALALACDLLYRDDTPPELMAARGRIEQWFGNRSPSVSEGRWLGEAGLRWLMRQDEVKAPSSVRGELDALDQLLRQLRVESFARLSVASRAGLEQRLDHFAATLLQVASAPTPTLVKALETQTGAIREHRLTNREPDRLERVEMALRLARWLTLSSEITPSDLPSLVCGYQREGCWVDRARYAIYHGDSNPQVAKAYAELLKPAMERREAENQAFGKALAE
jgi:hypothetical protein